MVLKSRMDCCNRRTDSFEGAPDYGLDPNLATLLERVEDSLSPSTEMYSCRLCGTFWEYYPWNLGHGNELGRIEKSKSQYVSKEECCNGQSEVIEATPGSGLDSSFEQLLVNIVGRRNSDAIYILRCRRCCEVWEVRQRILGDCHSLYMQKAQA